MNWFRISPIPHLALVYILCIGFSAFLWCNEIMLFISLVGLAATMLQWWHGKRDLICFALAAMLGVVAEAVAVHAGAWKYTISKYVVPLWLPVA
jgi:hypothetical protein